MNETLLLRSIAENNDDVARLALADLLEEHGQGERAEFVRVQCELDAPGLKDKRRRELRVRERALLDAHRSQWIEAYGLPLEDVAFERGLILGARLSNWDNGRLLEPELAARLVTLKELDFGEPAEGYAMTSGQADLARRQYLRTQLLPVVTRYFQTYDKLQSAMLCVAQYWADEANDAVHGTLIVSELPEPVLDGVGGFYEENKKAKKDPNLTSTVISGRYGETGSEVGDAIYDSGWDDNGTAIPLWAAFAPENGSQEYQYLSEVYAPAVMFYRHGGYQILPMQRSHLDGIRPEEDFN